MHPDDVRFRPPVLGFSRNLIFALAVVFVGIAAMLRYGGETPQLHTMLDSCAATITVLIALLLWDVSRRGDYNWPLFLAISFAIAAIGEVVHMAAVLGWLGTGASDPGLRGGTWGPPAHLLPIALGGALLLPRRRPFPWIFALVLVLAVIALVVVFRSVPRYTERGLLGISRPSLTLVPLIWAATGLAYWRFGQRSEIARAIAVSAIVFVMAHIAMLYSMAPNDAAAMIAHFDKVVAAALLLLNLTQIGVADSVRRREAERQLTELNRELDAHVIDRTARLHDSEERAALIVDTALDAVISIDQSGVITGWNPQAEETFGWQSEEALGGLVDQFIMPERFREAHRAGLARYLDTGEARVLNKRIEITALHRDGHEFPVELAITPIRARGIVSFSAFVRDISERRLAETRLQAQLQRLHLLDEITRAIGSRQDLRSIFQVVVRTMEDRLPADFVCMARYDRVDNMLTVEHVGVRSSGLGRELDIAEPTQIAIDRNGLSRCVAGQLVYEPDTAEVDFPFPNRLASHGLHSLVLAPIPVEDEVFGVMIVARRAARGFLSFDCEFLKQLAEHVGLAAHQTQLRDRLQRAYDDLRQTREAVLAQERLRAIGQMASGIAHDINNAISPVSVYTQAMLKREPGLKPELREYLELVGRVVKDITATVARLRDFYRNRESEVELSPLQLNDLVLQVVELTRARWSDMPQQRGIVITISTALGADLPRVMGNAPELREALTNLIFNAVDAMPGGGTITIRTDTLRSAGGGEPRVRLEVGDTGGGMDEEARKRCLEPFFTTKGERGTGLGLAMVYGTIQRHNARIDIESAKGEGTRVRLDFAACKAAPRKPVRKPADMLRLRLLIVDDDPDVLRSTTFVLKGDKHDITAADGGAAAIELLHEAYEAAKPYDLVITDLGMPYIDGNQVAAAVKELFPSTPVLLLTGWGRRMDDTGTPPAHIDFLMSKPPDLDELREIFLRVAGKSSS